MTCACSMHLALFPLDEQTCYLNIASCECPRHYRHHHRCRRRHHYFQFSLSSCYLNIASCEHHRHLCDQLRHYQSNQFPCCFLCQFFMKQGLLSWAINYPITLITCFFHMSHCPSTFSVLEFENLLGANQKLSLTENFIDQ